MRPTNHLADERSPYLRQHRHNPVDWYPWGEEAFAKARAENKPVFLSVGYSTCHWCHVMEHESFEDPAVAALLNAGFVSVKVDREERPDVDRVHMAFLQASTGRGGWPMSVWLTPELRPFHAGSYFPPEDRYGLPGFKTVLRRIAEVWAAQAGRVREQADEVVRALGEFGPAGGGELLIEDWHAAGVRELQRLFDPEAGGFGAAPKFPNTVFLDLLFGYVFAGRDAGLRTAARGMALATLRAIAAGGIRDHLGGGFHRYSVDARWRLPHFEKMLYDQALLAGACLEGWLAGGDPGLREAAEACLRYLETRLRLPGGAFAAAEDADSAVPGGGAEKREGAFYVWSRAELDPVLGARDAAIFAHAYGIDESGNLEPSPAAEFVGLNLPYRAHSPAETAATLGLAVAEVAGTLQAARRRLEEARAMRPAPERDDKVVCAWNGLALSAFARAAVHLDEPHWREVAVEVATFLRANLWEPASGRLRRSWCDDRAGPEGFAEDYCCLIAGLLDLHRATQDVGWLEWAITLQETLDTLFADPERGGYFASRADDPHLLVRLKGASDGAEPAAISVAVRNKLRLAALLHRDSWRESARTDARSVAGTVAEHPLALPALLAALAGLERAPARLVIAGDPARPATSALRREADRRWLPRLEVVVLHPRNRGFWERQDAFYASLQPAADGAPVAFLCEGGACRLPVGTPEELGPLLAGLAVR